MATTILLIRHGETAWNRGKIFRGTHDVPLNDNGRAQGQLLAEALHGWQIDAAYCSPLSRARQTAEIALAGRNVEIVDDERFKDFSYGDWTGLEEAEVARRWPEEFAAWTSRPNSLRVPGGDTLQEVFDRAFAALEDIASQHQDQTVAIFAHRVVNKLLVLAVLGLAPARFAFIRQDNCCVNEFERTEAGYVICSLNDTSHIRQSGTDLLKADF